MTPTMAREAQLRGLGRRASQTGRRPGWCQTCASSSGREKTGREPIRTRGWTYWHHLFTPRQLLLLATMKAEIGRVADPVAACALCFDLTFMADKSARLSRW